MNSQITSGDLFQALDDAWQAELGLPPCRPKTRPSSGGTPATETSAGRTVAQLNRISSVCTRQRCLVLVPLMLLYIGFVFFLLTIRRTLRVEEETVDKTMLSENVKIPHRFLFTYHTDLFPLAPPSTSETEVPNKEPPCENCQTLLHLLDEEAKWGLTPRANREERRFQMPGETGVTVRSERQLLLRRMRMLLERGIYPPALRREIMRAAAGTRREASSTSVSPDEAGSQQTSERQHSPPGESEALRQLGIGESSYTTSPDSPSRHSSSSSSDKTHSTLHHRSTMTDEPPDPEADQLVKKILEILHDKVAQITQPIVDALIKTARAQANVVAMLRLLGEKDSIIQFLTDEHCATVLQRVYPKLVEYFHRERHGPSKGDICRGAALWDTGGLYLDVDLLAVPWYLNPRGEMPPRVWARKTLPPPQVWGTSDGVVLPRPILVPGVEEQARKVEQRYREIQAAEKKAGAKTVGERPYHGNRPDGGKFAPTTSRRSSSGPTAAVEILRQQDEKPKTQQQLHLLDQRFSTNSDTEEELEKRFSNEKNPHDLSGSVFWSTFFRPDAEFVTVNDAGGGMFFQAFWAVVPFHPVAMKYLDHWLDFYRNMRNADQQKIGTDLLRQAYAAVFPKGDPRSQFLDEIQNDEGLVPHQHGKGCCCNFVVEDRRTRTIPFYSRMK